MISGDFSITNNNFQFLQYDNKSKEQRIIIFMDDESLRILSKSENWFMDGTFKTSPKQLLQVFTIHASIKYLNEYTTVPCAYILTSEKNEASYREIFGIIKDLAIKKNVGLNLFKKKFFINF